ncbi:MAG: hypothetical protein OEY05_09640 [Paracoccaceae bacterium]|jgi:hypothetical protein|nr:hypothetical protein [Paracoccaceae bacterium]
MKSLLTAITLVTLLAPSALVAQACDHGNRQAQISCAEGQSWDATTRRCITVGS